MSLAIGLVALAISAPVTVYLWNQARRERELAPTINIPIPVVGLDEIKEILGLPTFAALEDLRTNDPTFPPAEGHLFACGPIWWDSTIDAYHRRPDRVNVYGNIPPAS